MTDEAGVIENPVTGEHVTFMQPAEDAGDDLLEFKLELEPRTQAAPPHIHARQEEHVIVASGSVRVRLGRDEHQLGPGQEFTLPAGVAHTVWNDGEEDASLTIQVRPGLKTQTAIETLFGLARDGKTDKRGNPNPLQGALLAREYETFFAFPPVALQKLLLAPLVPIAKLLGYKARYASYSGPD